MGTEVMCPRHCLRPAPSLASRRRKKEGSSKPAYREIKMREEAVAVAYAGTAFSMSPSPRSLPVPKFFSKSEEREEVIDYLATRDLRRILGLD